MSSNIVLNGNTYSGIAKVQLPISDGVATFLDVNEEKEGTLLCTLDSDTTLKTLLTNHPIPLGDRTSCIVFLKCVGTNVASSGTVTENWRMFVITGGTGQGMIRNTANGLSSPDSLGVIATIGSENGSYFAISNNSITASNSTNDNRYYGSGNKMYYLVVPFDLSGTMTLTSFS